MNCKLCGKNIRKKKSGRRKICCNDCHKLNRINYAHTYYLKNKKTIIKNHLKWKKENPEKTKEYYKNSYEQSKELKKKLESRLYKDLLKNPRKYLDKV